MRGLIGFILLVCAGMAHASVTAAWKLAIDARIPDHESDGRVRTYVVQTEDIVRFRFSRAGRSSNVNPQDLTPST